MKSIVDEIIDLFEELDVYEAQELTSELATRGYQLIINRELKDKKRNKYGLYFKGFKDESKIAAIKAIRNLKQYNTIPDVDITVEELDLRGAKDYVEGGYEIWLQRPLAVGKEKSLKKVYDDLLYEYPKVTFEVVEEK